MKKLCFQCHHFWGGKCNANGKKFYDGYCLRYKHKDEGKPKEKSPLDEYEEWLEEWN